MGKRRTSEVRGQSLLLFEGEADLGKILKEGQGVLEGEGCPALEETLEGEKSDVRGDGVHCVEEGCRPAPAPGHHAPHSPVPGAPGCPTSSTR